MKQFQMIRVTHLGFWGCENGLLHIWYKIIERVVFIAYALHCANTERHRRRELSWTEPGIHTDCDKRSNGTRWRCVLLFSIRVKAFRIIARAHTVHLMNIKQNMCCWQRSNARIYLWDILMLAAGACACRAYGVIDWSNCGVQRPLCCGW